eukprot:2186487-Ditylum_brightwellii.AAC.1
MNGVNDKEEKGKRSNIRKMQQNQKNENERRESDRSSGENWDFPVTFDSAFPKQGEISSAITDDLEFISCEDEEANCESLEGNEKNETAG